jgi:hypothetical protein
MEVSHHFLQVNNPKGTLGMRTWLFRLLAGIITLLGMSLQFLLMLQPPYHHGIAATAINFFSYFTILTNLLIALCMLAPLAPVDNGLSRLLSGPSARTAVTGYGAVVALIYAVYLRNIGHDHGLERLADQVLHYVTPALFAIDWLLLVPKGQIRWTIIGTSLIVPALYATWTIMHGAVTGWYPYPFFNPGRIGHAETFANFARFALVFLAVSIALLAIDRALALGLGRRRQTDLTGQGGVSPH